MKKGKLSDFRSHIDPIYDYDEGRIYREEDWESDPTCVIENAPDYDDMASWENVYLDLAKRANKRYNRYGDEPDCFQSREYFIKDVLENITWGPKGVHISARFDNGIKCPIVDMEWEDLQMFVEKIYTRFQLVEELRLAKIKTMEQMPEWFYAE